MIKSQDIRLRDPFVLTQPTEGKYYLFGTTDEDPWQSPGCGFDAYVSRDAEAWEGPITVFRPPANFWAERNFWAPEVHEYQGAFFMFASFFAEGHCRGTQILHSESVLGPYIPYSDGPVTPADWECLDGTLYVDQAGTAWLVFCHEWVQVVDGEIWAVQLTKDLKAADGAPQLLFRASEAAWTRPIQRRDGSFNPAMRVTDGPFLYRPADGGLLLIWSSFSDSGYALGAARSASGRIDGPWVQEPRPILDSDGGHGMVFKDFSGRLWLTYHSPNQTPHERFRCRELSETKGQLRLLNGSTV